MAAALSFPYYKSVIPFAVGAAVPSGPRSCRRSCRADEDIGPYAVVRTKRKTRKELRCFDLW